MHAVICLGDGAYYDSEVFGYYCNISAEDDYERYLEGIYNQYYIVLDREKTRLVKHYVFDRANPYLIPSVLIVDSSQEGWDTDCGGYGCAAFLSGMDQDFVTEGLYPDILQKCISLDSEYQFEEYKEIRTAEDIKNLMGVSGCFHDAYIEVCRECSEESLYVLFDGVWGCKIEVWFDGDVSYSIEKRNRENSDPYWYGATVLAENGYVYLIDEEDAKSDRIGNGFCWFKARHMKYHVIPD